MHEGRGCRLGREPDAQLLKIGQLAIVEDRIEGGGEIGFDPEIMGERQQSDPCTCRFACRAQCDERIP